MTTLSRIVQFFLKLNDVTCIGSTTLATQTREVRVKLHRCNIIRLMFVPIALMLGLVLCSYLASVHCTRDVPTTADESVVFGSREDSPSQLDDHATDNVLVVSVAAHHVHHLPFAPTSKVSIAYIRRPVNHLEIMFCLSIKCNRFISKSDTKL